ncbi:endothelin-converting enzyme homolog [Clytia hemisphaerica]|uniref:Uncharacterized protein n=1 Tax=Clytia hemisphaerica TaxID=252671 RepID=A0A7M5XH34_9CNID
MRFYLNPCFTRYSFDKNERKRMPKKDHNYNQSCNTSNGSTSTTTDEPSLDKLPNNKLNRDQTFDLVDNYQDANDSLTMQFPGHNTPTNSKQKRRRNTWLCLLAGALILVLVAVVVTIVCVKIIQNSNPNDCSSSQNKDGSDTTTTTKDNQSGSVTGTDKQGNEKANASDNNKSNDVCMTEKCQSIAATLKKSMNLSADPCQDFHQFACGSWPLNYELPPSSPKLDTMAMLNNQKNQYLRDVIIRELKNTEQNGGSVNKDGFKSKLLEFYRSCMNLDVINKLGSNPLLEFIGKFGRWSPLKQWIQGGVPEPDITDLLILSHQYFPPSVYDDRVKSPMFKTIVKVNDKNSKQHLLEVNIPDMPITNPENYLEKSERAKLLMKKYALLQSNYVALLGPSSNAQEVLDELMQFEKDLAKIAINQSFLRIAQQTYDNMTLNKFMKEVGNEINWVKLVEGFFSPLGIKVTGETQIGIRSIQYFRDLNAFLKRTKKQTIKDFIIWVCVWRFGSYASGPYQEADFNFQRALFGIQERPQRWGKCIVDLEETMEMGLASLYVAKSLTTAGRNMATEMVKNITNAFRRNLVNVDWMDVSTKAKAFVKVDSIRDNIGYPDYVNNETYLDIMYKNVEVNNGNYFRNALNVYQEKRRMNMRLLNEPVDKSAYDLPPTLVEAYFDPNKNKMVFLAGILNAPFYDTEGPMALNYGALGLVVGHEVTHAFDDLGRQFDGNGERKNWWTASSTKNFKDRSTCIVHQYGNYTMYGQSINGKMTLGENIADNGGIKVAYMAYKDWERTHGKEKKLPGIPLTMDQLVFVSHGQVWCGAYREEYVKRALKTDYHSPAKYRTIGPLSNLKAFSDAFKCPLGTPMNPLKKCRVW